MRNCHKRDHFPFCSLINEIFYEIKLLAKFTGKILLVRSLGKYLIFLIYQFNFGSVWVLGRGTQKTKKASTKFTS